jgi:hypothetical protein
MRRRCNGLYIYFYLTTLSSIAHIMQGQMIGRLDLVNNDWRGCGRTTVLLLHLLGETEESHEHSKSRYTLYWPRFKPGIFLIRSTNDNHWTTKFGPAAV